MSYGIEYNKKIYKYYNGVEDIFILAIKQGDNNVWSYDNKTRAKEWYLPFVGNLNSLWKHIMGRCGSVEGGGLQKSTGWTATERYTIENYVKQYRSKVKNAKPLSDFLEDFRVDLIVRVDAERISEEKEKINRLLEKHDLKEVSPEWYYKEKVKYECSSVNEETLIAFFNDVLDDLGYGSHKNYVITANIRERW